MQVVADCPRAEKRSIYRMFGFPMSGLIPPSIKEGIHVKPGCGRLTPAPCLPNTQSVLAPMVAGHY